MPARLSDEDVEESTVSNASTAGLSACDTQSTATARMQRIERLCDLHLPLSISSREPPRACALRINMGLGEVVETGPHGRICGSGRV
jgi:hypothetical protein